MCTLIILIRAGHDWPVIIASNRDEMRDRPCQPPARHWPDRHHVTAGHDDLGGGTWLAVNDDGVVAGILNRINSLGPAVDKRSRGELPLDALDHGDAETAAEALSNLDPAAWRPFNLVIADALGGWLLINDGETPHILKQPIKPGLSMVTAHGLSHYSDRPLCARSARHLPRFHQSPPPQPDDNDWTAWQDLMADRTRANNRDNNDNRSAALLIDAVPGSNFATISSSLIALPRHQPALAIMGRAVKARWIFTPGAPGITPWQDVVL